MRALVLAALTLALSGCARHAVPLDHTFDSADALASAVLDALARHDRATLETLALSEREFREHVWPGLPASRPERNLPFDYVWKDLHQKSRAHLAQTLAAHGGRRYILLDVRFPEGTATYHSVEVARRAELRVRDESGGQHTVRLFGSVVRHHNRHKVFSYVVD